MKHKTFPKEGTKKLKEIIQDLKAQIRDLEARNEFLENQLYSNVSESKEYNEKDPPEVDDKETWRKNFIKRIKEEK